MASRTLTVALAADIDSLKKGLNDAEKVVNKSADQIADFGKKAAVAFAVVGAAATALELQQLRQQLRTKRVVKTLSKLFDQILKRLSNKSLQLINTLQNNLLQLRQQMMF
jgi:hypothetical protein